VAGEPILEMDNGASRLEVERLTRQMAVKANEREQARVDQDNRLSELKSQSEIKNLELRSREFESPFARHGRERHAGGDHLGRRKRRGFGERALTARGGATPSCLCFPAGRCQI